MPVEHSEPGEYRNGKNMTVGEVRAELIRKRAERELINSTNNCPEGKGLDSPLLVVNKQTQCNGRDNYRNRQQLRLSEHPKKQEENCVVVKLHRN